MKRIIILLLFIFSFFSCRVLPVQKNPTITIINEVEFIITTGGIDHSIPSCIEYLEIGETISTTQVWEGEAFQINMEILPGTYQIISEFQNCPLRFSSYRNYKFDINKDYELRFIGNIHVLENGDYDTYIDTIVKEI